MFPSDQHGGPARIGEILVRQCGVAPDAIERALA
jgi:hypothetical protein